MKLGDEQLAKLPIVGDAGLLIKPIDGSAFTNAKNRDKLVSVFPAWLVPGMTYHYITKARWSAIDLLAYMVEQVETPDVYISTWSINEDAARMLVRWVNEGRIKQLYLLLDKKVKVRNPKPLQLLMSLPNVVLAECHAKVSVVMGDDKSLCMCGSANYNNNRRIETGVIFTDREVCKFHTKWILNEFNGGAVSGN